MELPEYGRPIGLAVDPIEKKPLYHFLPGSSVLSFGTLGCNMTCGFCQNWSSSQCRETAQRLATVSPSQIVQAAKRRDCDSVAFTYNEPTVFIEYAMETARACRAAGLRTVAVTNGWISPSPRHDFYDLVDAANVDLKAFSQRFYRELCGADLDQVLDTISYIHSETSTWLELTTLLVPGENDSVHELEGLCAWIVENLGADVPLHFTAFHPDWKMLDKPATPLSTLREARDIALGMGIRYVYMGNIRAHDASATHCYKCGDVLMARDGYSVIEFNLTDDHRCRSCGSMCAGVFSD